MGRKSFDAELFHPLLHARDRLRVSRSPACQAEVARSNESAPPHIYYELIKMMHSSNIKPCRVLRPRFKRAPGHFIPTLILCAWLAMSGRASAGGEEASTALVSTALFSGAIEAGGLVALIGNSASLARRPPNLSWPISGYVLGSLNVAVGSLWFALFRVKTPLYAVGGSLIGLGLTDLGLAVAGHVKHVQANVAPTVAPSVGFGAQSGGGFVLHFDY